MQNAFAHPNRLPAAPGLPMARPPWSQVRTNRLQSDHRFVALLDLYRPSGGLARAQEVASKFQRCGDAGVSLFAGWILNRTVISLEWQSQMWLPLFQFSRDDMQPPAILGQVLTELACIYEAWDTANWFVQPQLWLSQRRPVDLLASDPLAVLNAARVVRFVEAE